MEIINANDISHKNGTYLLYGAPGMGKTSTLKYLPGKTLEIDIDRTSHVLKGSENIDIVYLDNVHTWEDWQNTLMDISKTCAGKYDNIAVDNISELERCLLSDLGSQGKNNGVPCQADYQYMQFRIVNSLRFMKTFSCNIILFAWEMFDSFIAGNQTYSRALPQLNMKVLNNVCGLCDVVGRLMINDKDERGYNFTASNYVYAKNQLDDRKGCLQSELIISAT